MELQVLWIVCIILLELFFGFSFMYQVVYYVVFKCKLQGEYFFYNYIVRLKYRRRLFKGYVNRRYKLFNNVLFVENEKNCVDDNFLVDEVEVLSDEEFIDDFLDYSGFDEMVGFEDGYGNELGNGSFIVVIFVRWFYERDDVDRFSFVYWRKIFQCFCGKLNRLFDNGFVELLICGEFFMLY